MKIALIFSNALMKSPVLVGVMQWKDHLHFIQANASMVIKDPFVIYVLMIMGKLIRISVLNAPVLDMLLLLFLSFFWELDPLLCHYN